MDQRQATIRSKDLGALIDLAAMKRDKDPLLIDALHVRNQLIDPHDGNILPPSQATFFDNHNFTWKELGTFTDPKSLIFHVVNRTVMVLNLGKE